MTTDTLKQAIPENSGISLGEFVLERLRGAIRDHRYQPGQRIREAEITQWLGVSRTPVREAFRRLQADGLLVLTPWRGAQVVELGRQQVVELYTMRRALEGTAAGSAAEHANAADVDLLFGLIEQDQAAQGEPGRLAEINRRFHEAIHGAAHNRYLLKALNALAEELVKNDSLNGERVREIVGKYSATTPGNKSVNGQAQTPQIDLPVTVGQSSTLAAK